MDLGPLRTLVGDVSFGVLGVSATVTRPAPDNTPVTTTGIWLSPPLADAQPTGSDFHRREPRRLLALRRTALATLPRGTTVLIAEAPGLTPRTCTVDGLDRVEADYFVAIVKG